MKKSTWLWVIAFVLTALTAVYQRMTGPIGFIGWLLALIALYKFKNPKRWIVFASILMFIIFLIPHSVLGSELDYNKLDESVKTSQELND